MILSYNFVSLVHIFKLSLFGIEHALDTNHNMVSEVETPS